MKITRPSQAAHNLRFVHRDIYPPLGNPQDDSRMSDALAGLRTEIPTQETGPLPAVSDGPQVAEARPAPGRYLATEERGELVLYALGEREGQSLHIGRSPASDIQLEDQSVSRRHAVVAHRGGRAVLLDDRSLNGIYVNGSAGGRGGLERRRPDRHRARELAVRRGHRRLSSPAAGATDPHRTNPGPGLPQQARAGRIFRLCRSRTGTSWRARPVSSPASPATRSASGHAGATSARRSPRAIRTSTASRTSRRP